MTFIGRVELGDAMYQTFKLTRIIIIDKNNIYFSSFKTSEMIADL